MLWDNPEWKERKGKIEGYYRDIGQLGMNDNEKISSISIVKSGDKLVVELDDGDGILYEITEDLINPFRMIKTVSQNEIEKFQNLTKWLPSRFLDMKHTCLICKEKFDSIISLRKHMKSHLVK